AAAELRGWLEREEPLVLNVAGSRESQALGIQRITREILAMALKDSD
ncbi:MAG: YpsA SLOG family protein, partial [Myxococcota bacterium]